MLEKITGNPTPIEVHVDGQRRRRRVHRQPALLMAHLGQVLAMAAELGRDVDLGVAPLFQLVEILEEEAVLAVVAGRSLAAALQ